MSICGFTGIYKLELFFYEKVYHLPSSSVQHLGLCFFFFWYTSLYMDAGSKSGKTLESHCNRPTNTSRHVVLAHPNNLILLFGLNKQDITRALEVLMGIFFQSLRSPHLLSVFSSNSRMENK